MLLLAFALSAAALAAQTPEDGEAPGLGARSRVHARATLGGEALAGSLLTAAVAQLQDSPRDWPANSEGYGRRFAAAFGQNAAKQGFELAAGAWLRQQPGYTRRGHGGFWRRGWHAVSSVVLTRGRDGSREPAWFRAIGAYGSAAVADLWYPEASGHTRHVLSWGTYSLGGDALSNLWNEFRPR